MDNRILIRDFKNLMARCDIVVAKLHRNMDEGRSLTHSQAKTLEDVQQHLTDLKDGINKVFEASE